MFFFLLQRRAFSYISFGIRLLQGVLRYTHKPRLHCKLLCLVVVLMGRVLGVKGMGRLGSTGLDWGFD